MSKKGKCGCIAAAAVALLIVLVVIGSRGGNSGGQDSRAAQNTTTSAPPTQTAPPSTVPAGKPTLFPERSGQYEQPSGGAGYRTPPPQQESPVTVSDAHMLKWAEMLGLNLNSPEDLRHLNVIVKGSLQSGGEQGLYKGMDELQALLGALASLPNAFGDRTQLVRVLYDRATRRLRFEDAASSIYHGFIVPSTGNVTDPKTGQSDPWAYSGGNEQVNQQRGQLDQMARRALLSLFGPDR